MSISDQKKPTFGSLFAGIGGIDLGLERAGWRCCWQVEKNTYCLHVLERHWPQVKRYNDVRKVTVLEPVDLIAGGFPCQPVSVAGRRRAQADRRWLWPEFARIVRLVRPRFVLVENVPNILNVNSGSAFGEVLGDLASCGYDAEWDCLPASAVGAPPRRYRVFIIAHTNKPRLERRGFFAERPRKFPAWSRLEKETVAEVASDLCGVDDGVPFRVEHLEALGNAVVPQVAEWIGEKLLKDWF